MGEGGIWKSVLVLGDDFNSARNDLLLREL